MYHLARTGSDPVPLDFNTSGHTDTVADASRSDFCPHDESPLPAFDTDALLSVIGLSAQAIREIQTRSSAPDV